VTWWCDQAQAIATPALRSCTPLGYVLVTKQGNWVVVDVFKLRNREEVRVSRFHCDVDEDCLHVGCGAVSLGCRFLTFRRFVEPSSSGVSSSTVLNSVEFRCQFCVTHFCESKNELRCFYRSFAFPFFFLLFCFCTHHKTCVM
jgi:hypothetical protein